MIVSHVNQNIKISINEAYLGAEAMPHEERSYHDVQLQCHFQLELQYLQTKVAVIEENQ